MRHEPLHQPFRIRLIGGCKDDDGHEARDDVGEAPRYLGVPNQQQLGRGRGLAVRFGAEHGPALAEQVRACSTGRTRMGGREWHCSRRGPAVMG